jgi:hypothetical protein
MRVASHLRTCSQGFAAIKGPRSGGCICSENLHHLRFSRARFPLLEYTLARAPRRDDRGRETWQGHDEEADMTVQRKLLLMVILAAAVPALAQQVAPTAGPAKIVAQGAASVPDFSGIWRHGNLPWFVPPASGPGPVTNLSRMKGLGVSDYSSLVGDYKNPILQPWAADVVKKKGELSLAGVTFPSPSNTCWPEPVPYLFKHMAMSMLQLPDKVVMLFNEDHEVRIVRMNQSHPPQVKPSWHGDAVGHYEGDTLVIDTVGTRTERPYAMLDLYGTPYSKALHVVERYRLIDYEAAKDGLERDAKENQVAEGRVDRNYRGKHLQLQFTVEDEGVFTSPWTATVTYRPSTIVPVEEWPESVCSENTHEYYYNKESDVPKADKPDF